MFKLSKERRSFLFFAITLLFWLVVFLSFWPNMLVYEPDGLYAGWINIWGDWAAHMSYTSSLALQNTFPPQFPILAGHILSYPFGVDYLSALLLKLGAPLREAMLLPSFLLSLVFVTSLLLFFKTIAQNSKTAALATFLFLFNGGLGFLWFFADFQKSGWDIFSSLPREYTHLNTLANIEWINIVTSEVIPQRGFLLGLPIALFNLSLFWRLYKESAGVKVWQLVLAGILTGLLPIIHMHSLSITLGFFVWTFLLTLKKKIFVKWIYFLLPATTLALVLVNIFYPQLGSRFLYFKPGWLAGDRGDNIFVFWVKNAGVMLFLPFLGFARVKRQLLLWSIPFWGLFVLANLFLFQPFAWDNTKYFTYWWLGASLFAAIFIERNLRKSFVLKILALSLFSVSVFSGALDVLRVTQYEHQKIRMFDNQSLRFAEWVKENTPKDSVFLTADNHDHPIPVLTGRTIIQGFPGWLWTYGIDPGDRKTKMEAVYAGLPEAETYLSELKINYIVLGPWERDIYKNLNEDYLRLNFHPVYQQEEISVFKTIPVSPL